MSFAQHLESVVDSSLVLLGQTIESVPTLLQKQPTRRLLLGYLFEQFHFVNFAMHHLAPAIVSAPSERLRFMYTEYLDDEYWHGQWLRLGLKAAGLSDQEIAQADPLPATMAMSSMMRWSGAVDPLTFAAIIFATEAGGPGSTPEQVRHAWDNLAGRGLLPAEALAPFRQHEIMDATSNHQGFAPEVFADVPPVSLIQQDSVRRGVLMFLRTFGQQHREMVEFYGPAEGPLYYRAEFSPMPEGRSKS
jgi:hypothetical protein